MDLLRFTNSKNHDEFNNMSSIQHQVPTPDLDVEIRLNGVVGGRQLASTTCKALRWQARALRRLEAKLGARGVYVNEKERNEHKGKGKKGGEVCQGKRRGSEVQKTLSDPPSSCRQQIPLTCQTVGGGVEIQVAGKSHGSHNFRRAEKVVRVFVAVIAA